MQQLIGAQPIDYGICRGLMYALRARYPFLGLCPIGRSEAGRTLDALMLGEGEQAVLLCGAIHAQESITATVLLCLCEQLCQGLDRGGTVCDIELRRVLSGRRVWIIPMCNPDGVDIARHGAQAAGRYAALVRRVAGEHPAVWQANARGVDLNHNFDAGWDVLQQMERAQGIVGPSARQWGGLRPESESETRALADLCRAQRFRHIVCLHTQGEEIYWQYGNNTPPQAELMARVAASVSGYRVAQPQGLASHGGMKDWFIESIGNPAFTLEMGIGQNPLAWQQFDGIYNKAREMLLLFAVAM